MKILVCLSVVPDTTTRIQPGEDGRSADLSQVQWIINPWDELALTRAAELRETRGKLFESLTVITVGPRETEPVLRKALAAGADRAIRIDTQARGSLQAARELARVIQQEHFDLILAGIESSDYNGSSVGFMLGSLLEVPIASNVSSIEVGEQDHLILTQETFTGRERIRMTAPLVAVVQKGIAIEPRIPAMRAIMQARQKPLEVMESVAIDNPQEIISLEKPAAKQECRMISPDQLDELMLELRNLTKVI